MVTSNQKKMEAQRTFFWISLLLAFCVLGRSQTPDSLHLKVVGHWDDNNLPLRYGLAYNDVWGYEDGAGNEYAIIGTVEKVWFFKIESSGSLTYIDEVVGGTQSLWRDIKTYDHYAYAVADEHSEGLMVIDLQYLPDSVHLVLQTTAFFNRAHNVFVDSSKAKLYAVGNVSSTGDVVILDLSAPDNPVQLAEPALTGGYVHDLFVYKDTAYCDHGSSGLYVYDMSTPASPALLGSLTSYPESGYNHACWRNEAGTHLAFTDETHDRGVKLADVSDLSNITITDVFRSALLSPADEASIAHNPMIKGDSLYISYYHDGIQVFDISQPNNVTRVAYYDTYPSNTNYSGYKGAWGVYPFLSSGRILGSDILNGLYVLEFYNPPMPVVLSHFEGEVLEEGNKLSWQTESEQNSAYFELQRAVEDLLFTPIARLDAAGESFGPRLYEFLDRGAPAGHVYYRLKQVDADGSFVYSDLIHLERKEQAAFELWPTLLSGGEQTLHFCCLGNGVGEKVQLYDATGRLLQTYVDLVVGENSLFLPPLGSGLYFLKIGSRVFPFQLTANP